MDSSDWAFQQAAEGAVKQGEWWKKVVKDVVKKSFYIDCIMGESLVSRWNSVIANVICIVKFNHHSVGISILALWNVASFKSVIILTQCPLMIPADYWSALDQVLVYCLTAPSHYLNQCQSLSPQSIQGPEYKNWKNSPGPSYWFMLFTTRSAAVGGQLDVK